MYLLEAQESTTELFPNQININVLNDCLAQSILQEAVKESSNDDNNTSYVLSIYCVPSAVQSHLQALTIRQALLQSGRKMVQEAEA